MSEFREEPVSGDWVLIAPGRSKRPIFLETKRVRKISPKTGCPFEPENLKRSGQWPPIAAYPDGKKWRAIVIPNKYPALAHGETCSLPFRHGRYRGRTGVGVHELVITRDHVRNFAALPPAAAAEVLSVLQDRCAAAAEEPCLKYAVPFFNWGPMAGASVWHPHYQFLAAPIVPGHAMRSLKGAWEYYRRHHSCARCDIIRAERKEKMRVIFENNEAIALAPYASKFPFEIRIMPKRHLPYFYRTDAAVIRGTAAILQKALQAMKRNVNDPDFNFFIHEAPVDGGNYPYHHWHIEVLPRISVPAGFEFSTGIYINTVDPDAAAAILRKRNV